MIDHTGIGVSDFARSAAFYDAVLGALGMRRIMQMTEGKGTDGIGYGQAHPVFWIDRFHPYGAKQHTAFAATSRARSLKAGGKDNGAPGLRDFAPGYYAAFVIDPDGNNMEAVFREG
jgi:catechol 2,3-dioxygenase-like lactoylglutathione lyase family enzyme